MTSTLNIVEFGDALLRTQDLDPVYVALSNTPMDEGTLHRLCTAYWCFYSLGAAARLAEHKQPKKFWSAMMEAALNESRPDGSKPWPRGAERRHFRGAQALRAVGELIQRHRTATDFVRTICEPGDGARPTFNGVSARAREHTGFGEWIAFKIADMSERVLGYDTDFSDCHLGIYKDPRQGAAVAYLEWKKPVVVYSERQPWEYPITDAALKETVDYYVGLWRKKRAKAPPRGDRPVNVQEIETIFCKYKSHLKGHYPLGKDTREIRHGLEGWGDLAQQLSRGLPNG